MRAWVVLLAVCACACGNNAARPMDCTDGEMRECYGGPAGTENLGPCRTGLELCSGGQWPGICVGDIVPRAESCNKFDDDCNGVVDDAPTVGDDCAGTNGCTGARACDAGGSIRCFAPSKNECGLCNGPDVTNVGDECISDEGCVGAFVCATDMTFAQCNTTVQNECGLCGGPTVTGLTDACMSADSCPGMNVCNPAGDAAVCNAPLKNECLACFPSVGTPGATCAGDHGCVGVGACNGTGDALMCTLDAPCGHVMISEVATNSTICATDEFVELYNPTTRSISLSGYSLRSRSASSGNFTTMVTFGMTATIAPHGYFLVAGAQNSTGCSNSPNPGGYTAIAGNTVIADAIYTAADLSRLTGGVWLTKANQNPTGLTDVIVVDVLGWDDNVGAGNATVFEGSAPAPAPDPLNAGSSSLERKANAASTNASMAAAGADVTAGNGYDTDDNAANFVVQTVRVPQNTSSTAEP